MKTNPNDPINARPYSHDERPSGNYEGDYPETFQAYSGLTIREYFAAMAMQGILAGSTVSLPDEVAECAINNADALIRKLNSPDK